MYPTIRLKKDEERRLLAGHLWVYSNEIDGAAPPLSGISPGALVCVESSRGRFLGIGYCNPHTLLSVRLLSRQKISIDADFFLARFTQALQFRSQLFPTPFYRWVYGESDGLPGLVIDRYDTIVVIQITTLGMWHCKALLIAALNALQFQHIVIRTVTTHGAEAGLPAPIHELLGTIPSEMTLSENGTEFLVNLATGQKTGWFYDQRSNRTQFRALVSNKTVLDLFSYVGAFGIQAAKANATAVTCVDSSTAAIDLLTQNAQKNSVAEKIQTHTADVQTYLTQLHTEGKKFDVIVLDPPAFVKRRKDLEAGTKAYIRLNTLALSCLNSNGILISCSCSMQFTLPLLVDAVRKASVNAKTEISLFAQGFQAPDHPIHPAIPETAYLKALFCYKK